MHVSTLMKTAWCGFLLTGFVPVLAAEQLSLEPAASAPPSAGDPMDVNSEATERQRSPSPAFLHRLPDFAGEIADEPNNYVQPGGSYCLGER